MATGQEKRRERMERILEALESGHSRASACSLAGVPTRTFSHWLKRGADQSEGEYVDFLRSTEVAEGIGEARYASIVIKEAMGGNWKAAMFILQKRYQWSDKGAVDNTVEKQIRSATLSRMHADIAYTKARTKRINESSDEAVLDRLKTILNESRTEASGADKGDAVH